MPPMLNTTFNAQITTVQIPQLFSPSKDVSDKKGNTQTLKSPTNKIKQEAFLKVVQYLKENDDETNTLATLVAKMKEYIGNDDIEPYSTKYMQTKLIDHLEDDIAVAKVIICE